jgi:glutathione synthase/RimK-type ligase-like ATP-grasp enzyme
MAGRSKETESEEGTADIAQGATTAELSDAEKEQREIAEEAAKRLAEIDKG